MCKSVPQMDATFTFTSTSVRPKAGIFTSRISAPASAFGFTTASIVPAIVATYKGRCRPKIQSNTKHTILAPAAVSPGDGDISYRSMCFITPPAKTVIETLASKNRPLAAGGSICAHLLCCDSADLWLYRGPVFRRRFSIGFSRTRALQRRLASRLPRVEHDGWRSHCGRRSHSGSSWQPDHEPPDLPLQRWISARRECHLCATRKFPARQLSPDPKRSSFPACN